MGEQEEAQLKSSCISEFKRRLARHIVLTKKETSLRNGQEIIMERISKAQTLWEHVRRLSEMNQKRARSQAHAQDLVKDALQHTEDAVIGSSSGSSLFSGPDNALAMPSRTERKTMLASKKTTDWVVQEGGASLSRALDAVHDVSDAAKVVEASIRSLDVKISNATKSVRRAIRKSGDISKRVNATRPSFGEAKSKYTSVERQWNLLEARRKRLMKPWNQQIQIDVSA